MQTFKFLIGGQLVDGAQTMAVINPATEQPVADAPRANAHQINEAVAAAKAAYPAWSAKPIEERRKVLLKIADAVEAHVDELARLLTQEQGKPLTFAKGEVGGLAAFFRYFAGLELGVKVVEDTAKRRVEMHRRPLGVVAAIIPWNFPIALLGSKLPTALLAGNTVVVKPAATTPLSTLRFGEIIKDVVPPGVINVIADANDLGDVLTRHADVRKVSFTGSTATGKRVMACAAETLKRVTLELGGNDAAIVLDDVDPKQVAQRPVHGRVLQQRPGVHRAQAPVRAREGVRRGGRRAGEAGRCRGGRRRPEGGHDVRPAAEQDAVREGQGDPRGCAQARQGRGGRRGRGAEGLLHPPTIVRDITEGARLVDEEQFGPVLPVIKYSDVQDAVRRANASPYGLGGSVWSSSSERAVAVASQLECGTAWINKHCELAPNIPFGGAKSSGMGVEFAEEGLAEFTQVQVISVDKPAAAAKAAA